MRKAFGEMGVVKVSQAVSSLSKTSKTAKKCIQFISSTLHIFYMTRKIKKMLSEDPFYSLQIIFACLFLLCIHPFIIFKKLFFCIGVQLINNVVIVSGEQSRDSATHIHVSIFPQTSLSSRLPHNIEQSSMCYRVGLYWLSVLNTTMCT